MAASLGINVAAAKLVAFAIAACIAGTAGVLTAYQFEGVTPGPYVALGVGQHPRHRDLEVSAPSGAVVAGTLAIGGLSFRLLERIVHLGQFELLISGIGLVLTAVLNPEGIAGVMRTTINDLKARSTPSRHAPTPVVASDVDAGLDPARAPELPEVVAVVSPMLEGVRVVEAAVWVMGPGAAAVLADWGGRDPDRAPLTG